MEVSMADFICGDFQKMIDKMNQLLRVEQNFDIIYRVIKVGNRRACIYCIDGFVKDEVMNKIQVFLLGLADKTPDNAHELSKAAMPYVEVDLADEEEKIITMILSGVLCLIVEGYQQAVLIDCRKYPMRSVEEPQKYKVLRGSRDGFVETLVSNAALIRRRIRSTKLSFEIYTVGESSKTDVAICYMDDRVNQDMLADIRRRVKKIKIDSLTMNQESLAECLHPGHWFNPFPKFKYSERPDATCASILEGHIILLVDNSPAAMIVPTTIFDVVEEADDYYFPPVTGTYLRFARTLLTLVSILLTPIYLLLYQNPGWVPQWLEFINIKEQVFVPVIVQILILELSVDGLKLAAINTPNMLNTPLSIIAAIVIGEYAIQSGWFNAEVLLYTAIVEIANFTHESYELGYAIKFMRIIILVAVWIGNLPGLLLGIGFMLFCILSNRTITGTSYIYPLIPFHGKQLLRRIFRVKLR